jgi:hypothetical protein
MRGALVTGSALVLAAALAAGCSNGEEDDSFTAQADAICADYDERIAAVSSPANLGDLADSAGQIADLIAEGTDALRELEPPASLAGPYAEWLDLNDEAVDNARRIATAAEAGDRVRVADLAVLAEENEAAADELAEELGLRECLIEEASNGR